MLRWLSLGHTLNNTQQKKLEIYLVTWQDLQNQLMGNKRKPLTIATEMAQHARN